MSDTMGRDDVAGEADDHNEESGGRLLPLDENGDHTAEEVFGTSLDASEPARWSEERQAENRRKGERWSFLVGLPRINLSLLASGVALIALGFLRVFVPPLYSGAAEAVHPYTTSGRQQTCESRLQEMGLAIGMYCKDNDGYYPLIDNGLTGAARETWVSALKGRTAAANLQCTVKSVSDERTLSGYGLNPVLGGGGTDSPNQSELAHPELTLLAADRGERHDLALLPALAGWSAPSPGQAESDIATVYNVAFRHGGEANFLYADGHAEGQGPGDWLQGSAPWGGNLALRRSKAHLGSYYPLLAQVQAALDKGDEKSAGALLAASPVAAKAALAQVMALWKQNRATPADDRSDSVEKWGWQLARLRDTHGDDAMLEALQTAGDVPSPDPPSPPVNPAVVPPQAQATAPAVGPSSTDAPMPGEVFPETRMRLLSAAEVQTWTPSKVRYAINEMYARYGLTFKNHDIQRQFLRFGWYHTRPELSSDAVLAGFTAVEKANLGVLIAARR